MSAETLLRDPAPNKGTFVCVTGMWRIRNSCTFLIGESGQSTGSQGAVLQATDLDAGAIDGDRAEVCGTLDFDPRCFGIGASPESDVVCVPNIVKLGRSGVL